MKRYLTVLLSAALMLSLLGCQQQAPVQTVPNQTTASQETAAQTTPPTETLPTETLPSETVPSYNERVPYNAISLPPVTEETLAADGTILFQRIYQQDIELSTEDAAVSDKVVLDLLNRIDGSSTLCADLIAAAEADYNGTDEWVTYFVNTQYSPMRIDQSILSLYGAEISFGGGLHSAYTPISITYDLLTGEVLNIQDILSDDYQVSAICDLIVEALAPYADAGELFGDYEQVVRDIFDEQWLDLTAWYLSNEGLCFYFEPYEIGPYASGTVSALIPYEKLVGILQDAYFPAEGVSGEGKMEACLLSQADSASFSQFMEVTTDNGGEQILLYADRTVTDVRIDKGEWDMDGVNFLPSTTIFAADALSSDKAVLLTTFIPDTMPNLRLSYTSGEAEVVVYISQSGEDGSILLLDN